jgi:hypothetical protein
VLRQSCGQLFYCSLVNAVASKPSALGRQISQSLLFVSYQINNNERAFWDIRLDLKGFKMTENRRLAQTNQILAALEVRWKGKIVLIPRKPRGFTFVHRACGYIGSLKRAYLLGTGNFSCSPPRVASIKLFDHHELRYFGRRSQRNYARIGSSQARSVGYRSANQEHPLWIVQSTRFGFVSNNLPVLRSLKISLFLLAHVSNS